MASYAFNSQGLTRYCSLWWPWLPEGQTQVWVAVLKCGAAGGRSHTPLDEHSYRSAAADPRRENTELKNIYMFIEMLADATRGKSVLL